MFGASTVPVHLLQIALHAGLIILTRGVPRRLGYLPPLLLLGLFRSQAGLQRWRGRERRISLVGAPALVPIHLLWRNHLGGEGPRFGPDGNYGIGSNLERNLPRALDRGVTPASID